MKSKLTSKRVYKRPSLKTHGNVEQLTKGSDGLDPIVGSGGEVSCPPGYVPIKGGRFCNPIIFEEKEKD